MVDLSPHDELVAQLDSGACATKALNEANQRLGGAVALIRPHGRHHGGLYVPAQRRAARLHDVHVHVRPRGARFSLGMRPVSSTFRVWVRDHPLP